MWVALRRIVKSEMKLDISTPVYSDKVRFVCISDTHGMLEEIINKIPLGDVLIHAGDFSKTGKIEEVDTFNKSLGKVAIKNKIII